MNQMRTSFRMFPGIGLSAIVLLGGLLPAPARAQQSEDQASRYSELERRVGELEQMLREVRDELARAKSEGESPAPVLEPPTQEQAPQPISAVTAPAEQRTDAELPMAEVIPTAASESVDVGGRERRLPLSGYMDYHLNKPGGDPATADFHRFVLLFGHSFNDRIQFWSELELEHALVEADGPSGELELEQAYLDFFITPRLNFRAGIMLAPVGLINERHEPPMFNGVERPFVDTVILPSTWFDSGAGIFGDLGKGFTYKAYVMSALDSSRFNAEEGIRGGRQKAFESSAQNPAFTGRVEYHGLPGLSLGGSFWTGRSGFATPGINPRVNVAEFDGRFSVSRFDFRGEFAQITMDQTARLNSLLQRTAGVNPNIAERMRGFYWETAYHLFPRRFAHDLVAFMRYENFDTQNRMAQGFLPLKQFDRAAWVTGLTYFPEPDVALKFDYTILRNESRFVRARDSLNFGIGWWF